MCVNRFALISLVQSSSPMGSRWPSEAFRQFVLFSLGVHAVGLLLGFLLRASILGR